MLISRKSRPRRSSVRSAGPLAFGAYPRLLDFRRPRQHACLELLVQRNQRGLPLGERRDLLLRALPEAGFDKLAPADGAFYIYADVGHLTNDSDTFCRQILADTGVALAPGLDFDPERGHRFVRFSYAETPATVKHAAALLAGRRR